MEAVDLIRYSLHILWYQLLPGYLRLKTVLQCFHMREHLGPFRVVSKQHICT